VAPRANKYKVPRIAFVNKMDPRGRGLLSAVQRQIGDRLKGRRGADPDSGRARKIISRGVVDLVKMKAIYWDEENQGIKFE